MNQSILEKYAKLTIAKGINVQPNQPVVIRSQVVNYEFVRLLVKEAYALGASKVVVDWTDEEKTLMDFQYQEKQTISSIANSMILKHQEYVDEGFAAVSVVSATPGLMSQVDQDKINAFSLNQAKALEPFSTYLMNNRGQWTVIALPTESWAVKVFPELSPEAAFDALWAAILKAVRISDDNDPQLEWDLHNAQIHLHNDMLNNYNFSELHFKNARGTDVVIGLVENHIWGGGNDVTTQGIEFNPNMPTEESFTMPDRNHVEGKIVATMPLDFRGQLIEDFWVEFKHGRVENYGARSGLAALKSLIESDEGSRHLGEVALISHDSPISDLGILFYNTLFDENASCHVALGRAYPFNLAGGEEMSEEELLAHGANTSVNHVDFMFGSRDMSITGIDVQGNNVVVFKNGNFFF